MIQEFQKYVQSYKNCILKLIDFYYNPRYSSLSNDDKGKRAIRILLAQVTKQGEILKNVKELTSESDVAKKLEGVVVEDIKLKEILEPNIYLDWVKELLEITKEFTKATNGIDGIGGRYNIPNFRIELPTSLAGKKEKITTINDAIRWVWQWTVPANFSNFKELLIRDVSVAFTEQEKAYLEILTNAQKTPKPGQGKAPGTEGEAKPAHQFKVVGKKVCCNNKGRVRKFFEFLKKRWRLLTTIIIPISAIISIITQIPKIIEWIQK